MTEEEWAREWALAVSHSRASEVVSAESFVEAIQRDAWEQGVKDGQLSKQWDGSVDEPVFPGDLK